MNPKTEKLIDWGLIAGVFGLLVTVVSQTITIHERIAVMEQRLLSNHNETQYLVDHLKYRIEQLEGKVKDASSH